MQIGVIRVVPRVPVIVDIRIGVAAYQLVELVCQRLLPVMFGLFVMLMRVHTAALTDAGIFRRMRRSCLAYRTVNSIMMLSLLLLLALLVVLTDAGGQLHVARVDQILRVSGVGVAALVAHAIVIVVVGASTSSVGVVGLVSVMLRMAGIGVEGGELGCGLGCRGISPMEW